MFNKIFKKQSEMDLSKANLEERAWREKLLKHAEKMIDDAKAEGLTLQEFRMAGELAMGIISKTQESKKLSDILYAQQSEKPAQDSNPA